MPKKSVISDPLAVDKELLKELKIDEEIVTPIRKLGFLQGQLQELETTYWRSRVDCIHAARLKESDNEVLRNKGLERESTHKNEVRQFWGAIQMVRAMIDQLREEYPELKVEPVGE